MVLEGYPELTSSNFPIEEETEINPYTLKTIQNPNSLKQNSICMVNHENNQLGDEK